MIMAAHLETHIKDGVHAEHVSSVQLHSLTPSHLLQFLLHSMFN